MEDRATATPGTPDINARIASRVRALRTALGMTLDALAAKCDVSRSMISLVERGESSPTAVVLEKIATGLRVPLATLFEDSSAPASPVSRRQRRANHHDLVTTSHLARNEPGRIAKIRTAKWEDNQ